MRLFNPIEKVIYFFRDIFWTYPNFLFLDEHSVYKNIISLYKAIRPISHILLSVIVLGIVTVYSVSNFKDIVRANNNILIEGVLVGVDKSGKRNVIQKVNPLVISTIQIEKDLNDLIYESLVTVDVFGKVNNQLIEAIVPNKEGDNYRVKLKEGIYWHDSTPEHPHPFTAKDVEATFHLLKQLDFKSSTKSIFSTAANKRITFVPIQGEDYRFEFSLHGAIPNFYELISFKILPAKYIKDLNINNILTSSPEINRHPIGTGKFKFMVADENSITLGRNEDYYDRKKLPKFGQIRFLFFEDEDSIIRALESGQIHATAGLTTGSLGRLANDTNITLHRTGTIYTQFYSIFFNLSKNANPIFKDVRIRQALSSAIDRNYLIKILDGEAEESYGPIGKNSFAFADVKRYTYNLDKSNKLLDTAGWLRKQGSVYRSKDGKLLAFNLLALDNVDRNRISSSIVKDMKAVGVRVKLIKKPIHKLNQQNVLPRNFDTLLFGVNTFIDPDRFELFHSSQIHHPGLNLVSYISSEKTVKIVKNSEKNRKDIITVPEVDFRLENGRSITDEKSRIKEYHEFQRIVANEVPMIFLYHPILNYAVNNRVKGIDISDANTLEERYLHVDKWTISL